MLTIVVVPSSMIAGPIGAKRHPVAATSGESIADGELDVIGTVVPCGPVTVMKS
ncbi:hypothetical protein ACFWIW_03595 [Amycolatopsis sp. NPDC058340]|uniref:hypothetical protein n=1 Tax=Amycolatopsis sp. NPDC058340 TaxID=3346453 RepID=UPI0036657731